MSRFRYVVSPAPSHPGVARTVVGSVGQMDFAYLAISSMSARLTRDPPQVFTAPGSSIR
jgi:hypothetical protein